MKVLAIVQVWDSNHSSGGFIVRWMEALSQRVDDLIVLTLEQRQNSARSNIKIYSLGKEKYQGAGCYIFYLWQWHQQLKKIIQEEKPDIVFTHMTPVYSIMVYPYVFRKKIPITTWFIHPKITAIVKLAHFLSAKVFSATIDSYPYKKDKLLALGHGIDTELFVPIYGSLTSIDSIILCVSRISSVKDHATLLRAVNLLKSNFNKLVKVVIVGETITEDDRLYFQKLKQLIKDLSLENQVTFQGAAAFPDLPRCYQNCALHVNPTKPGSFDKAAFEAMACGKPSLVASHAFAEVLGDDKKKLMFRYQDAGDLAQKIFYLLNLTGAERDQIGYRLRSAVIKNHSLGSLMEKLVINLQALLDNEIEEKYRE